MTEKSFQLELVSPQEFYGANNRFLNIIKSHFPKLKITARGHSLKVNGDPQVLEAFEDKLEVILEHYHRYNSISERQLEQLLQVEPEAENQTSDSGDQVLLHGVNGTPIKAKSPNQRRLVEAVAKHDMVFAIGPAGTGKTYTGVALAVRALKNKEVRRIILTRPAVEAGENLGFLPGDLKEKLDPYLQPLYDALRDMIPYEKLSYYMETRVIEIAPLAFMRGRTLDNAFVILDEAQNTTPSQMKMFLTRMGGNAKFVVTGDMTQVDLPRNQKSGLREVARILKDVKGISFIRLTEGDVIRHKLVKDILRAYETEEKNTLAGEE